MLYGRICAACPPQEHSPSGYRDAFLELRGVFDAFFSILLEGDICSFGSQYSRVVYACRKYDVAVDIQRAAVAFRHRSASFAEKTDAHAGELAVAASTLAYIMDGFGYPVPAGFPYAPGNGYSISGTSGRAEDSPAQILSGIVTAVSPVKTENGRRYYNLSLLCPADGNAQEKQVSVTVVESYAGGLLRSDLMRQRELLREYFSVNITAVSPGAAEGVFRTTARSLLVIEPDYLVDVTDIAGCFTQEGANANMFLLSKLSPENDSEAMLKGTLINDLLDACISDSQGELDVVFKKALEKNILKAARYGGAAVKRIWDSVLAEHGENIALFARSVSGGRITVEPSFISALYGIQGRLDVLVQDARQPDVKDIYELKSGRAPSGTGLWKGHQIQVACYNMLLESVYGHRRRGTSALFYSSAQQYPMRNFLSSYSDQAEITAVRNEIVGLVYRIAGGDYSPLENIEDGRFGAYPPYARQRIDAFSSVYRNLDPVQKKYYRSFLSFSVREMLAARTGAFAFPGRDSSSGRGFSSLWNDCDEEKRRDFSIVDTMRFIGFDAARHTVHFTMEEDIEHTFRKGDVVVVYPHTFRKGSALKNEILKGTIDSINGRDVVFIPRGSQVDTGFLSASPVWAMEHDMMEKNYWAQISSLCAFLSGKSTAMDMVFCRRRPRSGEFPYVYDTSLTPNQNESVEKALRARDCFLLQGPPGTGKTSGAIMGIVRGILSSTQDNITLLAFTNRAVEEIAVKLRREGLDFLRLGHGMAGNDDQTLSRMVESGMKINDVRRAVKSKRIILSTVSGFAARAEDLKNITRFDTAVIDEASQLTEIQLTGVLPYFKKFILVGDQKQLPSVVVQSPLLTATDDPSLNGIGLYDLGDSLFERLYSYMEKNGYDDSYAMLDTHFRMHDDIAALVNPFYSGALKSGTGRQKERRVEPRIVFYPSPFEPSYKKHLGEARLVSHLLAGIKKRYGDSFSQETVGVVTPWRAQIAAIRNSIDDAEILEKVTIDTVERFQGGEKDIIIVSLAVFTPAQIKMLQSLNSDGTVDRKLNVTVSRAREELVILGYEPVLYDSPFYGRVLAMAEKRNTDM